MNMSKVCLAVLGIVAMLGLAIGAPATASAAPTLVAVTGSASQTISIGGTYAGVCGNGTVGMPSGFYNLLPGGGGIATPINFDTAANSSAIPSQADFTATQYYQSLGVTFSLVSPASGGVLNAIRSGDVVGSLAFGSDYLSGPNTLGTWNTNRDGSSLTHTPTVVSITFTPPLGYAAPRVAGFDFVDGPYLDIFTVRCYDTLGNLVGTINSNTGDTTALTSTPKAQAEDHFMGFMYYDPQDPTVGIGHLEYTLADNWTGTGPYVVGSEIDNLTFETRFGAPEPATLAMLGLGAVLFVRRRFRR
jgi:hypothetical protein